MFNYVVAAGGLSNDTQPDLIATHCDAQGKLRPEEAKPDGSCSQEGVKRKTKS